MLTPTFTVGLDMYGGITTSQMSMLSYQILMLTCRIIMPTCHIFMSNCHLLAYLKI